MHRNSTPATKTRDKPGALSGNQFIPKALTFAVLSIAIVLLIQRGALRALDGSWDFTMIYAGARQVTLAEDPYDFASTFDAYAAAGGEVAEKHGGRGRPRDPAWFHSLYPPTAYILLSPVGTLQWDSARAAWLLVNLLATAMIAVWLVSQRPHPRNTESSVNRDSGWILTAIAVGAWWGSASLHTALAFGQMSVLVLALMLPSIGWRSEPGSGRLCVWHAALAGLLLAIAGWLKPQLVGPIAVVLLATPRRAVVGWAAGWGVVILAGSVAWMGMIAPDWIEHWQQNLRAFTSSGLAEASGLNPYTYQLIHLEPWLHRWWPDGIGPGPVLRAVGALLPAAVWLGATATLALTASATGESTPRVREDQQRFVAIALVAVLTLLMAYHRTYDAVLLVLPGAWAWRALAANRKDAAAWTVLASVLLFTVPGPVALEVWGRGEGLAAWLSQTWVWRVVLLPHHTLALIAIAVLLTRRLATAQAGCNERS